MVKLLHDGGVVLVATSVIYHSFCSSSRPSDLNEYNQPTGAETANLIYICQNSNVAVRL